MSSTYRSVRLPKKKRKEEYLFPRAILVGAPLLSAGRKRFFSREGRKIEVALPWRHYPLPGDTVDWGCFHPVTTRSRLVTIDFERRLPISNVGCRFRAISVEGGRKKKREKKNLE
ncbi:hypothetical protein GW17_00047326 [Ensete ventricosum]|nr:hypothetical protein GW17_00047326 [Ensete ventricosum]